MLIEAIIGSAIFAAGVAVGRNFPTVLAAAKAELHVAQAEAERIGAALIKFQNPGV